MTTKTAALNADKVSAQERKLTQWITDNSALTLNDMIDKLNKNTDFTQDEKYKGIWAVGMMMGKEATLNSIIKSLYKTVNEDIQ